MKREESLKEEGRITLNEYVRELGDYTFGEESMVRMFVLGANYADQHPRKGLWDGEKVIGWLKENIGEYYMTNEFEEYFDSMYEDLKKAMED